jgi:hypothetical protein
MAPTTRNLRSLNSKALLVQPLSADAAEQAQRIQKWRSHIAETQAFVRLAVAFLQAKPKPDLRQHMEGLFLIEARVIAMLPFIDLSDLHTGHTPDQSGVNLVRPDAVRSGVFLRSLRERICARLRALATASENGLALEPLQRAIEATTNELTGALDLLELLLFPRVSELSVGGAEAIDRAAQLAQRKVTVECDDSVRVAHVRGLYRLLATLIDHCDDSATVSVTADPTRAVFWLPISRERLDDDRLYFIRFCAHLGKMTCERDDHRLRLAMPLLVS